MTAVVQFVEIDVPHCALTYSVFPCRAQLGFADGSDPELVRFGSSYARRAGGLTGAADSNKGTGSFWFKFESDVTTGQTIFCGVTAASGTTTRFRIQMLTGVLRITAANSGGTTILDIRTSTLVAGNLYHCSYSFDLSNTGRRHLYVDGVSALNVTTFTNSTVDYTLADWALGGLADGSGNVDGEMYVSQFWFQAGIYLDLSIASNREKFRDSVGRPVFLGDNGEIPLGSSPIVFFQEAASSDYANNYGTGGDFTVTSGGDQSDNDFATGDHKCFNSLGTCQDRDNFDEETATFRFSESVDREFNSADADVTVFPFIKSIDYQPAIVSLEGEIGQRATLKVVFRDAPHSDAGAVFDKYITERAYNPYELGTFWGKFRARNPYMRGRQIRLYVGEAGQSLESLEARYFMIDSMAGPTPQGEFTITGQDIIKFASGDRVVAPRPSNGFLTADITTGDITIAISPPGALADPDYGTDGYACIGGSEVVHYENISGNNVDINNRGSFNTAEETHNAQDRFQVCLNFDSEDPADVIATLLTDFADIDGGYIPIDDWHVESAAYLGINISLLITEPTSVDQLLTEILEATGSALWWDDINQVIRWQVIRSISTTADRYTEDNVISDSLEVTEQPEKRVSQVIIYFGQINPTIKVDETRNYRSTEVVTDADSEALEGSSAIKIIYARAIAAGGRAVANRIATRYLSRYVRAPRQFKLELLRFSVEAPHLGGGYLLGGPDVMRRSWPFQSDTGDWVDIPIQLTRVSSTPERWTIEAEEMLADARQDLIDTTNRTVILDSNQNNVNLKQVHDSLYNNAGAGDTVNCYINSGVTIGSNNTGTPAFDVGSGWDGAVVINVFVNGRVQGCGGAGGNATVSASSFAQVGFAGGKALFTTQAINLENNGQIWGGGGGGGATFFSAINGLALGGGGGAGTNAGNGGTANGANFPKNNAPGQNGSDSAGGLGGNSTVTGLHGGNGGGPGLAGASSVNGGQPGNVRAGGAAGAAIDGISHITLTGGGSILGSQIN